MGNEMRLKLLGELGDEVNAEFLALFLGDRNPVGTKLASDVVPVIYQHLLRLGKTQRLALVLYTTGGSTLVPPRLVRLLREFCNELLVYVPFRAHSAGTMICLAADSVYLSPLGELSPIDPTISSPLLPRENGSPGEISIEDVVGYLELARDRWGLTDQEWLASIFVKLVERLHPLPLGNVHRTYEGIRVLAHDLLKLRGNAKPQLSEQERDDLIDHLTSRMWFHGLPIARDHAQAIGMRFLLQPNDDIDALLTQIYNAYALDLELQVPFVPDDYVRSSDGVSLCVEAAFVDSAELTHAFVYEGRLESKAQTAGQFPPGIELPRSIMHWTRNRWCLVRDESKV